MIKSKIDKQLLSRVVTLDNVKKIECIVKAFDFSRLKSFLHNRKIEIVHEYLFIKSFRLRVDKRQLLSLTNLSQVNIAVIDTGINTHCDFLLGEKRIVYFKDFISNISTPYDDNGHGTFVAGVCVGNGSLSGGKYSGVAPRSKVISLKALNGAGEASADKILDAMEWIYNNHKRYDIKVVCMSFGSEPLGYNDPIMSGSEALWNDGVVVVAAAGNSGPEYQTIKSPGVSSQIITVGGFDDNRFDDDLFDKNYFEIAKFSSRGPAFQRYKPDLIAPSVDIISCGIKKPYIRLSGTSVATPMVAGLVALILEKNQSLSPIEVKRKLLSCCKPISYNKNLEGFGYPILS